MLTGVALIALTAVAQAASCPAVTVTDMKGVAAGAFPQQFELAEFQTAANCTLTFNANPDIAALNGKIRGNPELPPLAERLPAEPLVVAPYDSIGKFGGTFDVITNASEAGTAGLLSVRHVNLVRYSDDLQTIVPMVAKGWKWNDDYTQLTFFLRKGHKWSDGAPFTSADVKYWYDNLALNPDVMKKFRTMSWSLASACRSRHLIHKRSCSICLRPNPVCWPTSRPRSRKAFSRNIFSASGIRN